MLDRLSSIALAIVVAGCIGDSSLFGGSRSQSGSGGDPGAGGAEGGEVNNGGATTDGGSGGGGPSSGGSGGTTSPCAAGIEAASGDGVLLWTRLDDLASVENPGSGDGEGAIVQTSPANDFAPARASSSPNSARKSSAETPNGRAGRVRVVGASASAIKSLR